MLGKEEAKEESIQLTPLFWNKGFLKIAISNKTFQTLERIESEQLNSLYQNQCQYKTVLIRIKRKGSNFYKQ